MDGQNTSSNGGRSSEMVVATQTFEQQPTPAIPADDTSFIDEASFFSASSNDTASDLTGAGRVVGNLYSWAGRRVERAFRRARRTRTSNAEEDSHSATLDEIELDTMNDVSTNATTSNLVGPGRLLGLAYGIAGRRLERVFCKGRLIYGAGYGPLAIERRIQNRVLKNGRNDVGDGDRDRRIVSKLCGMLLNYTHWPPILQTTALWVVMDLAIWSPSLRGIMRHGGAVVTLSTMVHRTYTVEDPAVMNTAELALAVLSVFEDDDLHLTGLKLCPFLEEGSIVFWSATQDGWLTLCGSDDHSSTLPATLGELEDPFTKLLSYLLKAKYTWTALLYLSWWSLSIEAFPALGRVCIPLQLRLCQTLVLLINGGTVPRAYPAYALEILGRRLHASLTSTLGEEITAFLRGEMQEERIDVNGANLKILDVVNSLNSLMDGLQVSGLTFFHDTYPLERLSLVSEVPTSTQDETIQFNRWFIIPSVLVSGPLAFPNRKNWKVWVMDREMSSW